MKAYRLHRSRFEAWDTNGALKFGGRWNSPGTGLIYASSSLALCCLEIIVHLRDPELVPTDYVFTDITVPDELCGAFPFERDTEQYYALMESEVLAREWGDQFARGLRLSDLLFIGAEELRLGRSGILSLPAQAVPSLVIPQEWNFVINPRNEQFKEIEWSKPERFRFDPRTISPSFR